ncbi:MAG TPA: hypothetical protein VMF91_17965 [Bryobacteraceae bacterium]|nr:hypothetical protein [Bryobacteraceae bacterium]
MSELITSAAPAPPLADPDAEFIARAQRFLAGFGANPAALDPDVDLVDTGVLDSLLLLAFLAFVEEQRGHEAQLQPEDIIAIRKLRTASALIRSSHS